MSQDILIERLFASLVAGDRPTSRRIMEETLADGVPASRVLSELCWPTHERIEQFYKFDQMTPVAYHSATRLLRTIVDQMSARLEPQPSNGKSIFAVCGPSQGEELGGQMACDMLEAAGFNVTFVGSLRAPSEDTARKTTDAVPGDEVLAQVQQRQPDYLVLFSSAASDLPEIRRVIDTMREIGACKQTQIVVGGGVFNRAEGLAEEMDVDLSASSPLELIELLCEASTVKAIAPRLELIGAKKKVMGKRAVA